VRYVFDAARRSQANPVAGRGAGPERVILRCQDRQVHERKALPGDDRVDYGPQRRGGHDAHTPPWPASSVVTCPMHLYGPPLMEAISSPARTGRRHIGHLPDRGPLEVLARMVIYGLVVG